MVIRATGRRSLGYVDRERDEQSRTERNHTSHFFQDDEDYPPRGYVTDDAEPEDAPLSYGAVNRFTPDEAAMACYHGSTKEERWCTLNSGTVDYLVLHPYEGGSNCGTISWTPDPTLASAGMYRKNEGIDITDRVMRFDAKEDRLWFEVDLSMQTYCQYTTLMGFPQEPDNLRFFEGTLYFCTDGRTPNGVYGLDKKGYFPLFYEIDYNTEAAGLDFSPDGKFAMSSFQDNAVCKYRKTLYQLKVLLSHFVQGCGGARMVFRLETSQPRSSTRRPPATSTTWTSSSSPSLQTSLRKSWRMRDSSKPSCSRCVHSLEARL